MKKYAIVVEDEGYRMFSSFAKFDEQIDYDSHPTNKCLMSAEKARKLLSHIKMDRKYKKVAVLSVYV